MSISLNMRKRVACPSQSRRRKAYIVSPQSHESTNPDAAQMPPSATLGNSTPLSKQSVDNCLDLGLESLSPLKALERSSFLTNAVSSRPQS